MKATRLPSGNYRALAYIGRDEMGKRIQKSFTGPTPEAAIHKATEYVIQNKQYKPRTIPYYDSNGNLTVDPKLYRVCSETIGNHGGVYCFTTGSRRPLYVGKSSLLYSRIPASFATYIKEKGARIFYYCEDNNVDRTVLEILLISEWKPKYNRVWKKQDGQRFKSGLTLNDFKEIKLSETPD